MKTQLSSDGTELASCLLPVGDLHRLYFQRQRDEVLEDFKSHMSDAVMASNERALSSLATWRWKVTPLRRFSPRSVLMITKGHERGGPSKPELWARSTYKGYRRAFRAFLTAHHGLPDEPIPAEWHVDHFQSRMLFRSDPTWYLRLGLIPAAMNTAFGAGFEKALHNRERTPARKRGYTIDYLTLMKLCDTRLPARLGDIAEWVQWAWRLAGELEDRGIGDRHLNYRGAL